MLNCGDRWDDAVWARIASKQTTAMTPVTTRETLTERGYAGSG